jgi:hypothetical protein
VIGKELQNPAILPENVYNMDETGIMLSMLNSVKVLVGKDDTNAYRRARVKRTMVTAVECISADGRSFNPMIIWPSKTHRANWTTYPTPGWVYAISDNVPHGRVAQRASRSLLPRPHHNITNYYNNASPATPVRRVKRTSGEPCN